MLALYRLLIALLLPFLVLRLAGRVLLGREPPDMLWERLGLGAASAPGALWLHAASNGELASARPLIEAIFAKAPETRFLITSNTVTARAMARGWAGEDWARGRIEASAAPFDARPCLRMFLNRRRPAALIVIENELWPNRLLAMQARGLPVAVAGGKMSARSAARWRKSLLGPRLMGALVAVAAQDPASAEAFAALGLPRDRLLPVANLKTAVAPAPPSWSPGWPRDDTILAASTHEGEEALILDAFAPAYAANPTLRLILAPRHPRRAAEIARLIGARGLPFSRRSRGFDAARPVLLADTMGEMSNWYAAASLCVLGGAFVDRGGHTPFEPAAFGCCVATGPLFANHRPAFEAMQAADGVIVIRGAEDLRRAFATSREERARIAERGSEALRRLSGADDIPDLAAAIMTRINAAKITDQDQKR